MSYQVIARKYRPQRFEDVVGQDHVIRTLTNAIQQNRIAHAYLFSGPRGTGKTTIARIFAKCLNCEDGPKVDFAENDPHCQEITESRSLDVMEIDGASNRGIEEIRELRETVKYAPTSSRFKIYIIDEVHMLTKEAFNALLKTLEEPPAHAKFMFATTEPEKVLPTILSRCQRFDLRRIPSALIVGHLRSIAGKENVSIDEPALFAIARGADGGMRDAESTLDQLISFCGDRIEESNVLSMFGLAAHGQILDLTKAVLTGDAGATLSLLNQLAKSGKELGRLLSDLLNHFRNLLVYCVSRGDVSLLEISESEAAALREQSAQADPQALTRIMEVLTDSEYRIRTAASKKIALEVALLKAIEARNSVSIDQVLQQLRELREESPAAASASSAASARPAASLKKDQSTGARSTSDPSPALQAEVLQETPPASTPQSSAPARPRASGNLASGDLVSLWQSVVASVGEASKFAKVYLEEAHPVSLNNGVLTIGLDPSVSEKLALVDNDKNKTLIQKAMADLGHPEIRIKVIESPAPEVGGIAKTDPQAEAEAASETPAAPKSRKSRKKEAAAKPEPVVLDQEEFKNDPLIKQALDVFKGRIVDVKSPQQS